MQLLELPVELQEILKLAIEVGVVFLLTELSKRVGIELGGYKSQVTAAVFAAVMVVVNGFLAKVPASFESVAAALLNLLVVVLASFGTYKLYRQKFPKK